MNLQSARQEGRDAAAARQHADTCPYSFAKVGCDQRTFDRDYRPLLDAWFAGWTGWLDEHGLQYNFKPVRSPHA